MKKGGEEEGGKVGDFICPERDRLLKIATAAVRAHAEIVMYSNEIATLRHSATGEVLKRISRTSYDAAHVAWTAYQRHVEEHGC